MTKGIGHLPFNVEHMEKLLDFYCGKPKTESEYFQASYIKI